MHLLLLRKRGWTVGDELMKEVGGEMAMRHYRVFESVKDNAARE